MLAAKLQGLLTPQWVWLLPVYYAVQNDPATCVDLPTKKKKKKLFIWEMSLSLQRLSLVSYIIIYAILRIYERICK
jgi:hypothetical protein